MSELIILNLDNSENYSNTKETIDRLCKFALDKDHVEAVFNKNNCFSKKRSIELGFFKDSYSDIYSDLSEKVSLDNCLSIFVYEVTIKDHFLENRLKANNIIYYPKISSEL